MRRTRSEFTPQASQMALWPAVSGNAINGVGETAPSRPRPVYWHPPQLIAHGPLQQWFYEQSRNNADMERARARRQKVMDEPLAELASVPAQISAHDWTQLVKEAALEAGADLVGIARMQPEWVFEGYEVKHQWIVMLAVMHDFEQLRKAPEPASAVEVVTQYTRGNRIAKHVASAIRRKGHDALAYGGPLAGPMVLIPPAIECGFGELGKHGSLISRKLGSNFRLACVLTDVPLVPDARDDIPVDRFCTSCRLCVDACPPDAINWTKQMVRGETKWYVDFDRCLPYFNETMGCGVCLAVCPWSLPGVGPRLASRMSGAQR